MSKDDNIKKVMKEFEDFKPTKKQIEVIGDLSDAYKNKSDEDMFVEIIRVNEEMESEMSSEKYEEIFEKLDSIRPLLNEEQLEKLDKILKALGRE